MQYIIESEKHLPVAGTHDVVVVGGGIAGVAAALSAVRSGASACLIEKENALGGLATLGNVAVYLPICDGMGNRVIGGIGEELLKLSIRDGSEEIPACWRDGGDPEARLEERYRVTFNPASFLLELEDLVVRSGVKAENLITAGRCISAAGRAWDVARAIPVCAVTGEAAGTAAALACRGEGCFSKLDVTSLQDRLRAQNVPIDRRFASGGKG